jgi:hypothetical protein
MEHAGRSFARSKAARACLTPEERACAAWPAAVGKRLAGRARAVTLVRERLVVEVEDALWQRNLYSLRFQILENLAACLGEDSPRDIEFRIGVPRRPPMREETPLSGSRFAPGDEAAGIADAVLRRIYLVSRRRAGA